MDCPRCKLALSRDRYEGVEVEICQSCLGMWLDTGELETIIKSRDFEFSSKERQQILAGRTARNQGPKTPARCPKCTHRMERLYLDSSAYLVIDRCPAHGIWLDTGEVKAVQAIAEKSQAVSLMLLQKIRGNTKVTASPKK